MAPPPAPILNIVPPAGFAPNPGLGTPNAGLGLAIVLLKLGAATEGVPAPKAGVTAGALKLNPFPAVF